MSSDKPRKPGWQAHRNVAALVLLTLFLIGCLWGVITGGVTMWLLLV